MRAPVSTPNGSSQEERIGGSEGCLRAEQGYADVKYKRAGGCFREAPLGTPAVARGPSPPVPATVQLKSRENYFCWL